MKPLSCPSHFKMAVQEENKLSHKCSTLAFVRLFDLLQTVTVYREPHFWRIEGQNSFHFCLAPKIFNASSNLAQEIQFLKFMNKYST